MTTTTTVLFACTGSGLCCNSRGHAALVKVTPEGVFLALDATFYDGPTQAGSLKKGANLTPYVYRSDKDGEVRVATRRALGY